ncbi:unnamed protein product, partial [marine sediment metagenome]
AGMAAPVWDRTPLIPIPLAGCKKERQVVSGKLIPHRVGFWLSLILLLLSLMSAIILEFLQVGPAPPDHGGLDYSKTWFCLAVVYTFLDQLNVVAWAYCVLISLALVHLYHKARGEAGTHSLLAYAVPNAVVLLVVLARVTCMFAVDHAGRAVTAADLAKTTLYYESGEEAIYGGGASPLAFAIVAVILNAPFWLVLATRSWKHASLEVAS